MRVTEAAGPDPPYEGLVGGCKGLKAAARTLGVICLQLQGGTGLLSLLRSTWQAKKEPSWNPAGLPNRTNIFASTVSHFPLVSSSSYKSRTHFLGVFKSHSSLLPAFLQSKVPEPWVQGGWWEREADPRGSTGAAAIPIPKPGRGALESPPDAVRTPGNRRSIPWDEPLAAPLRGRDSTRPCGAAIAPGTEIPQGS